MGYRNIRFYSYRRWIGTLAVIICQELHFRARSGEALYQQVSNFELKRDLTFAYPCDLADSWGMEGIEFDEAALRFSRTYLRRVVAGFGAFDAEYTTWLNLAIEQCPAATLPQTEEPHDLPLGVEASITLFPGLVMVHEEGGRGRLEPQVKIPVPVPPGLAGAIEPFEVFRNAMQERAMKDH
jgi:hypothetical protein